MSLVFSSPSTSGGIVELIDEMVKTNSSTYPIASKVRDVNLALDRVLSIIFNAGGTWQFDDSNLTDYPIITANLVSGQRDYSFVTDGAGNLILDVYKVLVADQNGSFAEIAPYNVQSQDTVTTFTDGKNTGGVPTRYDKTANGIFLDLVPNYSFAGGLKVYINREGSYFNASDTVKKPGFAGLFHEYLALNPAQKFAARNSLAVAGGVLRNGSITGLLRDVGDMERAIAQYYGNRERDISRRMVPRNQNFTQDSNR